MQWVVDNLPVPNADIYVLGHSVRAINIPGPPQAVLPALYPRINGANLLSGPHTLGYVRLRVPLDSACVLTRMISARVVPSDRGVLYGDFTANCVGAQDRGCDQVGVNGIAEEY